MDNEEYIDYEDEVEVEEEEEESYVIERICGKD